MRTVLGDRAAVCGDALTSACAVQPAAAPPSELPAAFENSTDAHGQWPAKEWYRDFSSDELNTFIDLAVKNNWDLAGARARVTQADARARQAGSAILPSIDGAGNASFLAGHSSQGGGHELDWSAMLTARYEVDFWGKNRAAANSAGLLAGASRAERDALALTTLAGVANSYFQVLALRERLNIAQSNRDAALQLLALVQARYEAGFASPVDLATQETQKAAPADTSRRIAITDLQQMEIETRAALALLLGRLPENFTVQSKPLDSLR